MSQPTETQLQEINDGQMARILFERLKTHMSRIEADTLSKLRGSYREGKTDPVLLQVLVGQLVTLEDLEIMLRQEIRAGEAAAAKMERNH
jgi:hypothetical protein